MPTGKGKIDKALQVLALARETGVLGKLGQIVAPGSKVTSTIKKVGLGKGGSNAMKAARLLKQPGVAHEVAKIARASGSGKGRGFFSSIGKIASSFTRIPANALIGATAGAQQGISQFGRGKTGGRKVRAPVLRTAVYRPTNRTIRFKGAGTFEHARAVPLKIKR
jgi:hypothetical protein